MVSTSSTLATAALILAAASSAARGQVAAPVARHAAKGLPPDPARAAAAATDPHYLYVATRMVTGIYSGGAGATITQGDPALGVGDAHTLAEIWVASADRQHIVELGWTIDPAVNGDVQPRLFVFHWIDGNGTCYNGCGWVQVSPHKAPGMRVIAGEAHRYEIKVINTDWWLFYDGEALGYFPQAEWGGRFKRSAQAQWFGEVAAAVAQPCTQMGNGKNGMEPGAAEFSDIHVFAQDGTPMPAAIEVGAVTDPALYNGGGLSPTGFRFGGPGATTGCCTPATCDAVRAECGTVDDPTCAGNTLVCGTCETIACTADHKCPGGIGPRDDGVAFDTPIATSGGCCDSGGPGSGALALAAVVGLAVRRRRRAAFWRSR